MSFWNYYVLVQRIQKYSNISYAGMIFEKTEINNLFVLNLCQHVMAMGTYERTNCVN